MLGRPLYGVNVPRLHGCSLAWLAPPPGVRPRGPEIPRGRTPSLRRGSCESGDLMPAPPRVPQQPVAETELGDSRAEQEDELEAALEDHGELALVESMQSQFGIREVSARGCTRCLRGQRAG